MTENSSSTVKDQDGARLYYKVGQRAAHHFRQVGAKRRQREAQMLCLASNGYRCIAPERRGTADRPP